MRTGSIACTTLSVALWASSSLAHEPPSAERIKAAAEEFDLGRRAYLAKEFEQAAGHFENAFRDAPSKETLRLAIRARRDAKQPARAATLAAVAQEQYGTDAPTAQLASETLAETAPELAEYVVACSVPCTIAADGRVVSESDALRHRVFLDAGAHHLGVSFQQGGSVTKHVESSKGTSTPLAFEPPPQVLPPSKPAPREPLPIADKPLAPVVFFFGAGVTAALGAATIASGIATENDPGPETVRRECAGRGESCARYQEGQDAEMRTNVLLGVTIGAALATGVMGLFFTRWPMHGSAMRWTPAGVTGRF